MDKKICEDTAKFWIENGGDAESFYWTESFIYTILKRIEKQQ